MPIPQQDQGLRTGMNTIDRRCPSTTQILGRLLNLFSEPTWMSLCATLKETRYQNVKREVCNHGPFLFLMTSRLLPITRGQRGEFSRFIVLGQRATDQADSGSIFVAIRIEHHPINLSTPGIDKCAWLFKSIATKARTHPIVSTPKQRHQFNLLTCSEGSWCP